MCGEVRESRRMSRFLCWKWMVVPSLKQGTEKGEEVALWGGGEKFNFGHAKWLWHMQVEFINIKW